MKTNYILIFFILYLFGPFASAQVKGIDELDSYKSGDILEDKEGWVEVIKGDMPLVLSVPHGGAFHDEQIPDRACPDIGRVVKVTDRNTKPLALAVQDAFYEKYKKRPYVIIANLSRRKVDQNRPIELATCNDPIGMKAWHSYHDAVTAVVRYTKRYGRVFFVDVHGHGHKVLRLELGYSLTKDQLKSAYNKKHTTEMHSGSSLANYLVDGGKFDFHDMLFGAHAFGTLMEKNGERSTPSMQDPYPQKEEKFFSGGYITRKFTGPDFPYVFGLQIEAPFKDVRDTDKNRKKFAEAFTKSYWEFIEKI